MAAVFSRAVALFLFILAAVPAVSADSGKTADKNGSAAASPAADRYLALAERTLEGIRAQESTKDATCWTTVRMMDNFYALRPIDETAVFLKFEIMKTLLLKLWREADAKASGSEIDVEAVKKILPESITEEMPAVDPVSILNLDPSVKTGIADFHRITENWRTLVSVLFEQLAAGKKSVQLKIPTVEAADMLAKALTVLNIHLLREAKNLAQASHHERILQNDLKGAYLALLKETKLPRDTADKKVAAADAAHKAETPVDPALRQKLLELTRRNIDNKVAALTKWNGVAFDPAKDYPTMLERVNKISPMPVTEDALISVLEELRTIAKLVAQGKRPMRPDTMATSNQMFWFDYPGNPAYLQAEWIWNVLEEIFPRRTDISGDLEVIVAPNPARTQRTKQPERLRNVVLRGYELDAMRDTTIHWSTLKDVFSENEDVYPLEPFAGELMAERLSEIAFFLIKEGERSAKERGAEAIDTEDISSLFKRSTVLVPPARPDYGWQGDYSKEKAAVLKAYPAALFEDVSKDSGIPTPEDLAVKPDGPKKNPFNAGHGISLISSFGFGIAVGDYNGDKLPDLFITGDYKNRLYKNLGSYKFEDVSSAAGIVDDGPDGRQALFADVDNDGRLDLLVVHSAAATRLFLQTADGKFEDKTASSGIETNDFAVTAVFFDYNNDGLLDLFVGNYTGLLPMLGGKNGSGNQLYKNLGSGKFKNVTGETGLGTTTLNVAATALDYDQDGWTDLFIADDFGEDELYHNLGGKRFVNVASELGADDRGSGMNASAVDINYDGLPDLYVSVVDMFSKSIGFKFPVASSTIKLDERILKTSYYLTGNKLLVNRGGEGFEAEEQSYFEPGDRGWSWNANFFDYENDGDEDMYLANGWVEGTIAADQHNQMFIRSSDRFYLAPDKSPEAFAANSRSVIAADLTNTGQTDLIVTNYDTPIRIFRNNSGGSNHWLKVRLAGKTNRFGVGAQVRLRRTGLPAQTRYITAGNGFLSQAEPAALFGLGADSKAEGIDVIWPGGKKTTSLAPEKTDQEMTITEE